MPSGSARYLKPIARKGTLCVGCRAFVAEVRPGGRALCYVCAHHVVDHGVDPDAFASDGKLKLVVVAECECMPGDIYPDDYLERGRAEMAAEETLMQKAARR